MLQSRTVREGERERECMCLFLFNARDNFALDKIGAKSSQDHGRRRDRGRREEMIPRYRRHKTFKVQICMLQPVPHLPDPLPGRLSRRPFSLAPTPAPASSRLPNPKAQPDPRYFECKILSLLSVVRSRAHTRNPRPIRKRHPISPSHPANTRATLTRRTSRRFPLCEQPLVIPRIPRLSLLVYGQDSPAIDIRRTYLHPPARFFKCSPTRSELNPRRNSRTTRSRREIRKSGEKSRDRRCLEMILPRRVLQQVLN